QTLVTAMDVNSVNVMAPLDQLPLLLREGQLVPLLDASIDTLMVESNATVIGPTDVADVYDVVGLMTAQAKQASFTFADGTSLAVGYTSAFAPPAGLTAAAGPDELATCSGCYLTTALTPALTRVQISAP